MISWPYSYIDNFLIIYRTWILLAFIFSSISMKANDSLSKTPSVLIERLMNFTDLNWISCSVISSSYFEDLRLIFFLRLVSCPTVSSTIYRQLSFVSFIKSKKTQREKMQKKTQKVQAINNRLSKKFLLLTSQQILLRA